MPRSAATVKETPSIAVVRALGVLIEQRAKGDEVDATQPQAGWPQLQWPSTLLPCF